MSGRTKTERLRDIIIGSAMSADDKVKATDLVIEIERKNNKVRESLIAFAREMEGHRRSDEIRAIGREIRRGLEEP